jgi:hypothetical protein
VSFGIGGACFRTVTFWHEQDRRLESYELRGGSLLLMCPKMQRDWKHAILAAGACGGRISLTFRRLDDETDT